MKAWFLFLLMLPALAQEDPSIEEITKFLDELYLSSSAQGKMTMVVTTPNYTRRLSMESWSLGQDYSLVRILTPRKEKGISTLKRENEMWNWLPKIKKMIRVPPSMMMGSWMGSDFTNDDLMRESKWTEDYTAERMPDEGSLVVISFTPKPEAPVTWQKVVSYFERSTKLPVRQDFYDEKGRKVRQMTFDEVRPLGGKTIPCRITLTPLLKENQSTVVVYEEMVFDEPISKSLFTKNGLKKGS